jgi:hypothetical protein
MRNPGRERTAEVLILGVQEEPLVQTPDTGEELAPHQ